MARQMFRKVSAFLAGAALLLGGTLALAQTYDLVGQFSALSNPNGTWSYGWSASRSGPFALMTNAWTDTQWGEQRGWNIPFHDPNPAVALAITDIHHPTVNVPAGTVNTHPGPGGENAVVRWTVPESGTYRLEGAFTGNDFVYPTTTDVAVLRGPFEVISGFVESYHNPLPFSAIMPLLAGETIDLTVGFGQNGNHIGDSTGVSATITKISDNACTQPPAGMVGWWPADGNANDIINGNNGTLVGDVSYKPGIAREAFDFTGGQNIDQGVDVPAAPVLDVKTAITIVAWIKPLGVFAPIVEYKAPDYPNQPFGIHFWQYSRNGRPDSLYVNLVDTNHAYHQLWAEGTLTVGKWNHVAMTYDQTGNCSLYVNGMQVATQFFGVFEMKTDKGLYIGYRPQTPGDGWYSFNGGIDEVAIFNRALTTDEVRAIYLSGSAGMCKNYPPVANAGPDQTVEMTSCAGASVALNGAASADPDGDPLTYTWTENGLTIATGVNPTVTLAYGTHTITLTVADGKGGTATDNVVIRIVDTTPPALSVTVTPNILWPANHKYVKVTPAITVTDACAATTVKVTSNEPDNGLGDGDMPNDIVINKDGTISLRAERSGKGTGRIYTITYRATDAAGNTGTAAATVTVPHNR